MKPKTRFQYIVASANERMLPITQKQTEWAIRKATPHFSFRTKRKDNVCSDCGKSFAYDGAAQKVRCPHCGSFLSVVDSRIRKNSHKTFVSTLEVFEGIQVQRVFQINSFYIKGETSIHEFTEVMRIWHDGCGQRAITARTRSMFSHWADSFSLKSEILLRAENESHNIIADTLVAPNAMILPVFLKMGIDKRIIHKFNPDSLLTDIIRNPHIETILKAGRLKDLAYFLNRPAALDEKTWTAYKITLRRKYEITDISQWLDLVNTLAFFKKDITNYKFVCPDNLKIARDFWTNKRMAMIEAQRKKKEREDAKRHEKEFREIKSKFFDLTFSDDVINIVVLDSIKAFTEEGEAMHHCVAGYWNRNDSLVLSARIDGQRIETIELSLTSLKVLQSRAICNGVSEYHDRIINLVEANAGKVASRLTA